MTDDAPQTNSSSKPAEPPPAGPHIVVLRYVVARLKEPVTWVGLGFLWNCIQDNIGHLFTPHAAMQIGASVCAVVMRSPGSPWQSKSLLDGK